MQDKVVRIGGASAFFMDSAMAVPQLLTAPQLDYLVFDYLAEGSMGLFGRMAQIDPDTGYGTDFLTVHVGPHLRELAARRIRVVANSGGVNPHGLARAVEKLAAEQGVAITVAVVDGDDLRDRIDEIRALAPKDMFSGAELPEHITSINAYFGAFPIAEALNRGADIVITGRVVDSALTLGPLIHEFGWKPEDHDLLAAGTVAGHLLECGAQVTGGTFTDWRDVPDWAHIGYPIGECHADGSLIITKPEGTGGLVSVGSVAEQLLYEVSDPQAYIVPDVVTDMSTVKIEQIGPNRVKVSGARGLPPTPSYKVCVTYDAGWRASALTPIVGWEAGAKAKRHAESILERTADLMRGRNLGPFTRTYHTVIGSEASFGAQQRPIDSREVLVRIVVDHPEREAAELFAREQHNAASTMSPGTSINLSTQVVPLTELHLFLLDKGKATPRLTIGGETIALPDVAGVRLEPSVLIRPAVQPAPEGAEAEVPLIALAWARSGDKGNLFNVGIIARRPDYLPWIRATLTPDAVAAWYRHQFADAARARVDRYDLPGLHALNFVVHESLDGGINSSPRLDPVAKTMGQQLLFHPIRVPQALANELQAGETKRAA